MKSALAAVARRSQGRAVFARSSESRSCGTETLDGEDDRITLVSEGKGASNSMLPQADSALSDSRLGYRFGFSLAVGSADL